MRKWLPFALLGACLAGSSVRAATSLLPTPEAWEQLQVPGAWKLGEVPPVAAAGRFAWYRAWIKPHDSFFSKHERDLFAESVTLNLSDLGDSHEVFVNGLRIGSGGGFPPRFESGRLGNHRHKIKPGLLVKGQWNEVAIRVYSASKIGGFLGEAPFIMDYFNECVLEGTWQFRWGDATNWTGNALSDKPAFAAFDAYHDSNRVLREATEFVHGNKLPPNESLSQMLPHRDLAIDGLLHEPLIAQPTHLSFDERGRLWVSQYRQYPYPAGLKMLSRDKFYRAHYDKVPAAPPHHDRGRDVISIHEDTDGDGLFDQHKVFQDGLNIANASLRGRGGVWIMNPPYLLFYPDANFDDVPDGPPVVCLSGFGLEDTHSVANGLVWGLDGWLYGGQGSTTSSHVVRPGIDPPKTLGVYFEGAMVWRYHPRTKAYEVFAEGGGNTFGLEIDSEGRLFSGHNGGETRGWHFIQGGYYLKPGLDPGKYGPQRNPYTLGELNVMRPTTSVQRFSHFFAVAEGTAMPGALRGNLFAIDPIHSVVVTAQRHLQGSTFETTEVGIALGSEDSGFRPVFIVNAPDGSLYIADFYEHYIAHGQHYQSQIDPTTGRIYRLRAKDSKLERDTDLSRKSSRDLVAYLSHPNKWHRHMAVRLLGERNDPASTPMLRRLLGESLPWRPLGALWVLHQMGELDETSLLAALTHTQSPVRAWAVRLAGDRWGTHTGLGLPPETTDTIPPVDRGLPPEVLSTIRRQIQIEKDPEVRSQMAASARRFPTAQALELASVLAGHAEDLTDPFIPALLWWIFEHHAGEQPLAVLHLFKDKSVWEHPLISEYVLPRLARRFATQGRRQDLLACAEFLRFAPNPKLASKFIEGFEQAFKGRSMVGLPEELESALDARGGDTSTLSRLRRNNPAAVETVLAALQNPSANIERRILYAGALGELRLTNAVELLQALASAEPNVELRKACLLALGYFPGENIATRIIAELQSCPVDLRPTTFSLLLSRPKWTHALLRAVQQGTVPVSQFTQEMVERLLLAPDKTIRDLVDSLQIKRAVETSNSSVAGQINKLETTLRSGTGNAYKGQVLFEQRCAACHKLFHKGGSVGPDLTAYQRDNLGTMLLSILSPNSEIREGYAAVEVETKDGRSLTGFVKDRDAQILVLRGTDDQNTVLRQDEIQSLQPTGRSLMPEGLLEGLSDQQLRDFFAYLRSSQPFTK